MRMTELRLPFVSFVSTLFIIPVALCACVCMQIWLLVGGIGGILKFKDFYFFLILKCKNVSIPGCDLVLGMVQKGLVSHVHQHRGLEVGSNNPNGRKKKAKKEGGKKGLLEWKKQGGKKNTNLRGNGFKQLSETARKSLKERKALGEISQQLIIEQLDVCCCLI